jgi:hypothetical protein
MTNIIPFDRHFQRAAQPPSSDPLRAGIDELRAILARLTFNDDADRAAFTGPDYEGDGIRALIARTKLTETGAERQGYMAMASAAYVASQRLHKVAFWLDDAERWRADKDPAAAFRLADENFIIYAEQALLKNAQMHPDCTQHVYRALAASQTLVKQARALQALLGLPEKIEIPRPYP